MLAPVWFSGRRVVTEGGREEGGGRRDAKDHPAGAAAGAVCWVARSTAACRV